MEKQCLTCMFMLLLAPSTAVTQEFNLMRKQCLMFIIVSRVYSSLIHKSSILMRKQCLMFMLLLATSTVVTQELYLDEKTMSHVYVVFSRIYGSLFLYLVNSKSDATYTRTYLLMRKQCLVCMLLLAASERTEKNPLKMKL